MPNGVLTLIALHFGSGLAHVSKCGIIGKSTSRWVIPISKVILGNTVHQVCGTTGKPTFQWTVGILNTAHLTFQETIPNGTAHLSVGSVLSEQHTYTFQ